MLLVSGQNMTEKYFELPPSFTNSVRAYKIS